MSIASGLNFEGTAFGQLAFASGGLAQDVLAVVAGHDGLGMAEYHSSFVAASALHIHEVGVGSGDYSFEFVGLPFGFKGGM